MLAAAALLAVGLPILFLLQTSEASGGIRFAETGTSARSGFVPAEFAVSESGSPGYSIPLELPPGTGGVKPEISLVYGDLRSNGIMGVGWDMQGLSIINRAGKIIAQDSIKTGITFSNADRFLLNGQRLVAFRNAAGQLLTTLSAQNAAYGQNGTEYRTETESWTRVFSYGNSGNGPARFVAQARDGSVIEFGTTNDSRIQPAGAPAVSAWAISSIRDRNGNYVQVTYVPESQQGQAIPAAIRYTGNARSGLLPQREIQFTYTGRPDTLRQFIAGVSISMPVRLSAISTFVDRDADGVGVSDADNLVNTYQFFYSTSPSTGRSIMDSLRRCDAAGTCLPATRFVSTPGPTAGHMFSDTLTQLPASVQRLLGSTSPIRADVTGDGLLDLLLLESGEDSVLVTTANTSATLTASYWAAPSGFYKYIGAANSQTLPGDYNGDGLTDIALYQPGLPQLPVMLAQPNKTFSGKLMVIPSNLRTYFSSAAAQLVTGDFNGDGITDITTFQSGNRVQPMLIGSASGTLTGVVAAIPSQVANYINGSGAKQQIGDFNGDGLSDIAVFTENLKSVPMLFSTGSLSFTSTLSPLPALVSNAVNAPGARQIAGDYNGDGVEDFAIFGNGFATIPMIISQGNGVFAARVIPAASATGFNGANVIQVAGDNNGDGITDLTAYSSGYKSVPTLLSTGSGNFRFSSNPLSAAVGQFINAAAAQRFIADLNGDGLLDVSALAPGFTKMPVLIAGRVGTTNAIPDCIVSFTNGIGGVSSVTYKPITDNSVYKASGSPVFPLMSARIPLYVVASSQTADAATNATTVLRYSYSYQGAVIDNYRGWMGFTRTIINDVQNQTQTVSTHFPQYPFAGLTVQTRISDLNDTAKLMNITSYDYSSGTENGTSVSQVWNNSITASHYTNGHLNFTHVKTMTWDQDHRVVLKTTSSKADEPANRWLSTHYEYQSAPLADSLWWQAFYPKQEKSNTDSSLNVNWSWAANDLSWIRYGYDSRMNIITNQSYVNDNGAGQLNFWTGTSMTYDVYGNVLTKATPPNIGTDSIVSVTVFDSLFHTFPVVNITPAPIPTASPGPLTESSEYDPRFGTLVGSRDYNGHIGYHVPDNGIDGFGRILITQTVQPGSEELATRYVFNYGQQTTGYVLKAQQATQWSLSTSPDSNWLPVVATYDGLAREISTAQNGYASGVNTINAVTYNERGLQVKSASPYFQNAVGQITYSPGGPVLSKPLNTRQEYDQHGLLSRVYVPDANNPAGEHLVQHIVFDSTDNRIVYVWEPSPANDSVLIYWKKRSNGSGLLLEKSGPWNANGTQGENFSTASYKYDAFDRLVEITDPLGQISRTAYNSVSLVLAEYTPETDTVFFAYNANNWLKQRQSRSGQQFWTYDNWGRVLTQSMQAVGQAQPLITSTNRYDDTTVSTNTLGRLSQVILSEGTYTYNYDNTGEIDNQDFYINDLNKNYKQTFQYDAAGRLTSINYPDSSVLNYAYSFSGNLSAMIYEGDTLARYTAYTSGEQLIHSVYANGIQSYTNYDNLERPDSSVTSKGAFVLRNYNYDWNNANKLIALTDVRAVKDTNLSQQLSYYASGRLRTANGFYGSQAFTYDANGNRLSDSKYTYSYDAQKKNLLTGIWQDGTQLFGFTYSPTGELQQKTIRAAFLQRSNPEKAIDRTVNYNFDAAGRLTNVSADQDVQPVDQFSYNASDLRLSKRDSDQTVTWYVSTLFEVVKLKSGELVNTNYLFDNSSLVYATSTSPGTAAQRKQALIRREQEKREAETAWFAPIFPNAGGWAVNMPAATGWVALLMLLAALFNRLTGKRQFRMSLPGSAIRRLSWRMMMLAAFVLMVQPASAIPVAGSNGPGVPVAGEQRFFNHNHLGSSVLLTDENGGLTNSINYQPFGTIDDHTTTGEDNFRYKFTGKELDTYTNLNYFGARYYDSDLGRFISPDAANQYFSPYVYGDDDPMSGTDPDGNEFVFIIALIAAAIVGAYIGASVANNSFNPLDWEWNSAKTWVGMITGAAAGVAIVASGGAALAAAGVVAAESVALGSISASTLAFASIDVAFLATDSYAFATNPNVSNGIFLALDLIPFVGAIGKAAKGGSKAARGANVAESGLEQVPRLTEGDNTINHLSCPFSFAENTKVLTAEGEQDIEDIEVGDLVVAADPATGEQGNYAVSRIFKRVAVGLVLLVTSAGDTLAVTPEHPVYTTEHGWTEAWHIQPGDHLLTSDEAAQFASSATATQPSAIVAGTRYVPDTLVTVYNIEVERMHTYFVGRGHYLVHNPKGCGRAGKGGAHGQTSKFSERKLVESNHFPASSSYRGTPYAGISFRHKPAVTMLYKDHRIAKTTGSSFAAKKWRAKQTALLKQNKFAQAMLMDIVDMLSITNNDVTLKNGIKQAIIYSHNYKLNGVPLISATEKTDLLKYVN